MLLRFIPFRVILQFGLGIVFDTNCSRLIVAIRAQPFFYLANVLAFHEPLSSGYIAGCLPD
jgi:hypothetical protein